MPPVPAGDMETLIKPHGASPTASRAKLTKRFLLSGGLRWLLATTFSGLYYVVIQVYKGRTLNPDQKSILDALFIGLSIVMGLNVATALKDIASHLRWWFLDKRLMDISEVGSPTNQHPIAMSWLIRR